MGVFSSFSIGAWGSALMESFFINDLDEESERTLSQFAGDTELGEVVDAPAGCAAIQ